MDSAPARDPMERLAAEELAKAPPLAVIFPTGLRVQAVRLPNGEPGVSLELSNSVFTVPFAMDLDQARQHVNNVEQAILETRPVRLSKETPPEVLRG